MSVINYCIAYLESAKYTLAPKKIKERIQRKRLNNILKYAKNNSEYYSKAIDDNLSFENIKPINKKEFVENFDQIITDNRIKLNNVVDNIAKNKTDETISKYAITKTSGSTGNPTVIIEDEYFQNYVSTVNFTRFFHQKLPMIMIGEFSDFSIETKVINKLKNDTGLMNIFFKCISTEDPIDSIISQLQKIGPALVVGYTGVLTTVSSMLLEKKVNIKEKRIIVSGEYCSENDKELIKKAFNCNDVKRAYALTECGMIGCECKCGHIHIAGDCAKIEPVDENNNFVGYNKKSDKVLLTNLMNKIQPIIRYEVTDSIILHKAEECSCGSSEDWIEIEGRSNDNIVILDGDKEITVPSISLLIAMSRINKDGLMKFKNYQIFINKNKKLRLILDYFDDKEIDNTNHEVKMVIDEFFKRYGISNLEYKFEKGLPKKTNREKRKRIVMEK